MSHGRGVADVPEDDKFQYTYFAHKINSFDTAPRSLLASDSRLRPDRYALEQNDMFKAGAERSSLEVRQRAEKRTRESKGNTWGDRVTSTPWGDLEMYQYNGKYTEHRAYVDKSDGVEVVGAKEFSPWQYSDLASKAWMF